MSERQPISRFAVLALLGGVSLASPLYAATADESSPLDAPAAEQTQMTKGHAPKGAKDMVSRAENRIKRLHEKLKITKDQETEWNDVAQVMRDNASSVDQLIKERHDNAAKMTAVDDLVAYQKIADAHADGLNKLIPAFQTLYDDMSDEQKKNADDVFGRFEGRHGMGMVAPKKQKLK